MRLSYATDEDELTVGIERLVSYWAALVSERSTQTPSSPWSFAWLAGRIDRPARTAVR